MHLIQSSIHIDNIKEYLFVRIDKVTALTYGRCDVKVPSNPSVHKDMALVFDWREYKGDRSRCAETCNQICDGIGFVETHDISCLGIDRIYMEGPMDRSGFEIFLDEFMKRRSVIKTLLKEKPSNDPTKPPILIEVLWLYSSP